MLKTIRQTFGTANSVSYWVGSQANLVLFQALVQALCSDTQIFKTFKM